MSLTSTATSLFCSYLALLTFFLQTTAEKKTANILNAQPSAQWCLPSFLYFCRGNALRQGSAWRVPRATALLMVTALVFVVALWLYVTSLDSDITQTLVSQAEFVSPQPRVYTIHCSEDYNNYKRYPGELSLIVIWCIRQSAGNLSICKSVLNKKSPSLLLWYQSNVHYNYAMLLVLDSTLTFSR